MNVYYYFYILGNMHLATLILIEINKINKASISEVPT